MWATLYANQGLHENGGAFSHDRLVAMADAIDLDPARFTEDFHSAAAATAVKDGIDEALSHRGPVDADGPRSRAARSPARPSRPARRAIASAAR